MAAERTCRSRAETDHACGAPMVWDADRREWVCTDERCGAREEGRAGQHWIEQAKLALARAGANGRETMNAP